jgi:hypothetical protein
LFLVLEVYFLIRFLPDEPRRLGLVAVPISWVADIVVAGLVLHVVRTKHDILFLQRGLMISTCIVLLVCALQINSLFDIFGFLSKIYDEHLFKVLEGRWNGWRGYADSLIPEVRRLTNEPFVRVFPRLSGTFQEPSVLANFLLLVPLPILISCRIAGVFIIGRIADFVLLFVVVAAIIFTVSVTALAGLTASATVACVLYVSKNLGAINRWFLVLVALFGLTGLGVLLWVFLADTLGLGIIFDKLSLSGASGGSALTRLGTIYAGMKLFIDFPLGVGFGNHAALMIPYIPDWALNYELEVYISREHVILHSLVLRVLTNFGLPGLVFLVLPLLFLDRRLRSVPSLAPLDSLSAVPVAYRIFLITFMVLSISNVQIESAWFLVTIAFYFSSARVLRQDHMRNLEESSASKRN